MIDELNAALAIIVPAPDDDVTIEAYTIVSEPELHCGNCSKFAFETESPETEKSVALVNATLAYEP